MSMKLFDLRNENYNRFILIFDKFSILATMATKCFYNKQNNNFFIKFILHHQYNNKIDNCPIYYLFKYDYWTMHYALYETCRNSKNSVGINQKTKIKAVPEYF